MELRIKTIRQDVSFENDEVTNILVFEVVATGETFLAVIDDESVARLVEIRHNLPAE